MIYYTINDFLTLRLEQGKTVIYVKGEPFSQCMYLLLSISVSKLRDYDQIKSIDEAEEALDRSMERDSGRHGISPETEFWGHCSNIQAWAENDYNTCILHRNIAFPLLRKLTEAGDLRAKRVYKDEIATRFSSGHSTVMLYLLNQGYLKALNREEIDTILDDLDVNALKIQNMDVLFKIFSQIQRLSSNKGRELIKNQIKYRFENGVAQDIKFFINKRKHYTYRKYLNYFKPEELSELYNNINFEFLTECSIQTGFPILEHITQTGNGKAHNFLTEKIVTCFREKNKEDIRYIIKKRLLNYVEKSQVEKLFDDATIKLVLNPSERHIFTCLKHLPQFITSSEYYYNFLTQVLSSTYFVYKTQAAVQLINHFFDKGHELIKIILTKYQRKVRVPLLKALIEIDNSKSSELLKLVNWSRFRYIDNIFLKLGDKRISAQKTNELLLEHGFKAIQQKSSFTVYEISSHNAFNQLSKKIETKNDNSIVEFTEIEKSIIRDARIPAPAMPLLDLDLGPERKIFITFRHTSYNNQIYFHESRFRPLPTYSRSMGGVKDVEKVLEKKALLFKEAISAKPKILEEFQSTYSDFKNRLEKYYHDCNELKTMVRNYLNRIPELSLVKGLNIVYKEKEVDDFRKVYPSTFKPHYQKETNTLMLYEAHQWGKYHADTNFRVHESGVIMVFVNTFVNYSKRHNYHNAQVYFFFPKLKRFYTRKANLVKPFKNVSAWDISVPNLFGYGFLKQPSPEKPPKVDTIPSPITPDMIKISFTPNSMKISLSPMTSNMKVEEIKSLKNSKSKGEVSP